MSQILLHSTTRDIDGVITGAYFMVILKGQAYYQNCPLGNWVQLHKVPKKEEYRMAMDGIAVGGLMSAALNMVVTSERDRLMRAAAPAKGLRPIRKWLGISQAELGAKSGYGQTTIAAWENGERVPTILGARAVMDSLNLISKARGTEIKFTLDDLFP